MSIYKKKLISVIFVVFLFLVIGANFTCAATQLHNPLGDSVNDPRAIVGNVIRAILGIVGSLALAMFIYGGFTWVIAGGNEEKVKKGKDIIVWATFGLIVVFASYALVQFVLSALTGPPDALVESAAEDTEVE